MYSIYSKSLLVAAFGLILTSSAFATPVPADKVATYENAVAISLAAHPLVCAFTPANGNFNAGSLAAAITQSTSADIESGAQPRLIFSGTTTNGSYFFSVTTSSDDKDVVSVSFTQQACSVQEVNQGTIDNPQIVDQQICSTTITVLCQ